MVAHEFTLRAPQLDVAADRAQALNQLRFLHAAVVKALGPKQYCTAQQVHGCSIAEVNRDSARCAPEVDGLITTDPQVVMGIYVADCCALYLVDRRQRAIGLLHSGKKGTELNIAGAALTKMSALYSTDPKDVVAQLSPCIRPPFYEVDFAAAIRGQLRAAGVSEIHDCGENTGSDLNKYYSFRIEKGKTGRMCALLSLNQ